MGVPFWRAPVTSTTTVSCIRRRRVVHDTLLISASVAIRKSANAGQFTTRQATHSDPSASTIGIVM